MKCNTESGAGQNKDFCLTPGTKVFFQLIERKI